MIHFPDYGDTDYGDMIHFPGLRGRGHRIQDYPQDYPGLQDYPGDMIHFA